MNDQASKILIRAWRYLFALVCLALLVLGIQSECNRLTECERQYLLRAFAVIASPLVLLWLATPVLRPFVVKVCERNRESLENCDERSKRRFLKHPYLSTLTVIIPAVGLGHALSLFLGCPSQHEWRMLDYAAVSLMPISIVVLIECAKYFLACQEKGIDISSDISSKAENFFRKIDKRNSSRVIFFVGIHKELYRRMRMNRSSYPPFFVLIAEKMDKLADHLLERLDRNE